MRPQRWSLLVLIGLVVCAAVVSGVSLPLHRPHTRHTDTRALDGPSDAFIEVQSQAVVSEDSTPIENDYITFDEQPAPAPQHAPLNDETMRVYADQVKAVNSHTGQSVWGKSWSIVDDMFTPHPTKETPEISVSLKENLNKNVPTGATVDLEVTATTRVHGSQSAAMQEKDTLLVHLPTIAGDSEANLARAEFEAQTDPFQAQREAAIIEARATVTRAKDPVGHAIFSENDPDKALQKPTEVLPIEISVIEKQSRVSVEGATAARGGKKYGWLEKQYKLEDCLACRMVWRQVEMDVGPTHLWQKVQESFEHNCMDAQKSKIFFIACGDMYEDKNEMIKDYLSNKFSVQKMCERARMCGKGKADPEAWPHITIGEISDKQPIPGKFRVPKDKGGKKGKKKGKKKESNFLKALKGRVIKGLIDGGAALAAAGAGAIANGVKGLRVKKAKDLLTTIHDRVMTKARPLIKKFKDDMKARKKKGKKKK